MTWKTGKDLTGKKFGRLTAIKIVGHARANGQNIWECQCDCGKIHNVMSGSLTSGSTRSCGCLSREKTTERNVLIHTTHGKCHTRLYHVWSGMIQRCNNPRVECYERYGGRGIKVCDEWEKDFSAFYEWAVNNGHANNLTLDRKDNNGNYNPDNCRWATNQEQSNNRRSNRYIEMNGEIHTIAEWSRITGLKQGIISARIYSGWPVEDLLLPRQPAGVRHKGVNV